MKDCVNALKGRMRALSRKQKRLAAAVLFLVLVNVAIVALVAIAAFRIARAIQ
ncbi:MAG: hypothetical protein JW884_00340 [Deltaproteobacteria bacterium]|nr:hypothetical protein [Deltaproteobacteria bacterium]